jgi:hypothetical protein
VPTVPAREDCTRLRLAGAVGETHRPGTDHTDLRPTMLAVTGLRDDYGHDGRAIIPVLTNAALPAGLRTHTRRFRTRSGCARGRRAPRVAAGRLARDQPISSSG